MGVFSIQVGVYSLLIPPNNMLSGPRRYEYDIKLNTWLDVRDGSSLNQMLDEELSPIFNKQLEVGLGWME